MSSRGKMEVEELNSFHGSIPECGAIFMSNSASKRECIRRKVFGLPSSQACFVKQVKKGMILFLFEYERRELHGVFEATSDGAINIVPHAFSSSGKQFPAQVKFTTVWHCGPLTEKEFSDVIKENYFSKQKFSFGLSEHQVYRLLSLFETRVLEHQAPQRQLCSKVARPSGCSMREIRRKGNSNESLISNQVRSEHNVDNNLGPVISNMHYGGSSLKDERATYDGRYETLWNIEHEHIVDSEFPPDISTEQFRNSSGKVIRDKDSRRLATSDSDRAGNELDVASKHIPLSSIGLSELKFRKVSDAGRFGKSDRLENGYYDDNIFVPARSMEYRYRLRDSSSESGEDIDAGRLTTNNRLGNLLSLDVDSRLVMPVRHPLDNFRKVSEDAKFAKNDRFESKYYESNGFVPAISRECPNHFHPKWDSSAYSSKYFLEADSFLHDPARAPSTFLHSMATELQKTNISPTVYRDAILTSTLPYDSDGPPTSHSCSSTLGINPYSNSLEECAVNSGFICNILPFGEKQSPSSIDPRSTSIYPDVSSGPSKHIPLSCSDQYECSSSMPGSAYYENMTELSKNEGFASHPSLNPSLVPSLESRNNRGISEHPPTSLSSCIYPSHVFGRYPVLLKDKIDHKGAEYDGDLRFSADFSVLKEGQCHLQGGYSVEPISRDHHESILLNSDAHQKSESMYFDGQKKRGSVFSRLALLPRTCEEEENTLHEDYVCETGSSANEVMATIGHSGYRWLRARGSNLSKKHCDSSAFRRNKKQVTINSKSLKERSATISWKGISPDEENGNPKAEGKTCFSADEIMAMLRHSRYPWLSTRGCSLSNKHCDSSVSTRSRKQVTINSKSLKEHSVTISMEGFSPDEENDNQKTEGTPFLDFKRRSILRKNLDGSKTGKSSERADEDAGKSCESEDNNDTGKGGESADNKDTAVRQHKRRRLIRPDFGNNESTDNGNMDGNAQENLQVPSLQCSETQNDNEDCKVSVGNANENQLVKNDKLPFAMHQEQS